MNKLAAITFACLVGLVGLAAVAQASGYGYGYSAPSYGQNYERKTGFKTVSARPFRPAARSRSAH